MGITIFMHKDDTLMLTDLTVENAKPRKKEYKLSDKDGRGLYLIVRPNGKKYWRYRYRFNGKPNQMSLGTYPDISLDEARKRLAEARTTRALGTDPSKQKQILRQEAILSQENTFEKVAREWHGNQINGWQPKQARQVLRRLEVNLFPALGNRPINDIQALEFLDALRKVEQRGALSVARRCHQYGSKIFSYAVFTKRATHNVTAGIRGVLQAPTPVKNRNRFEPEELPGFMVNFGRHKEKSLTGLAMHLLILTFVRSKELRGARWDEIDWKTKIWKIPGDGTRVSGYGGNEP